jgi:hypothetical protein
MPEIVTKAEFALYLAVTKSRVTAWCKRGLPVRADGKIVLRAAVNWIKANCTPSQSFQDRGVNRLLKGEAVMIPYEKIARALTREDALKLFNYMNSLDTSDGEIFHLVRILDLYFGELPEAELVALSDLDTWLGRGDATPARGAL